MSDKTLVQKITIIIGSVFCVLLLVWAIFFFTSYYFASTVFEPGPLDPPKAGAWAQLKVGLTEAEVRALLGDPGVETVEGSGASSKTLYWEYTYSDGVTLFGGASDKAHVVYFDEAGLVTSFREPLP